MASDNKVAQTDLQPRLEVLRNAYRSVFVDSKPGSIVLQNLMRECFAEQSTFDAASDRVTSFNEGKRAVWIGIRNSLGITQEEIENIVARARLHTGDD